MGVYRGPPSPFVGGGQPLEPGRLPPSSLAVQVDDPPYSSLTRGVAVLAIIIGMWQPSLLGLPQLGYRRHLVQPAVEVVNDPPFGQRAWLSTVLRSWQPGPPQPILARRLNAALEAVPEDNPPFSSRTTVLTILRAWAPPPPQPAVLETQRKVYAPLDISLALHTFSQEKLKVLTLLPRCVDQFDTSLQD